MSSIISKLDQGLNTVGQHLEQAFRQNRKTGYLPTRYVTEPVYKACVGKVGEVAATGLSFLSADLIIHQLIPKTLVCLLVSSTSSYMPESLNGYISYEEPLSKIYTNLYIL